MFNDFNVGLIAAGQPRKTSGEGREQCPTWGATPAAAKISNVPKVSFPQFGGKQNKYYCCANRNLANALVPRPISNLYGRLTRQATKA